MALKKRVFFALALSGMVLASCGDSQESKVQNLVAKRKSAAFARVVNLTDQQIKGWFDGKTSLAVAPPYSCSGGTLVSPKPHAFTSEKDGGLKCSFTSESGKATTIVVSSAGASSFNGAEVGEPTTTGVSLDVANTTGKEIACSVDGHSYKVPPRSSVVVPKSVGEVKIEVAGSSFSSNLSSPGIWSAIITDQGKTAVDFAPLWVSNKPVGSGASSAG